MAGLARFHDDDLGRIFPMADVASARLMKIKARCLCAGGIIAPALKAEVARRANDLLVASTSHASSPARRHVASATQ